MLFEQNKKLNKHKDAMGLKVSYSLIVIDVFLVAVRMFNKNAAEACIAINDAIWGNLTDLISGLGDTVGQIPYVGDALESFIDIFADISSNIESLLNILPLTLYNFWEILFWVFILMTASTALPVIIGKYTVERQYIKARINRRCEEIKSQPVIEVDTVEQKPETLPLIEKQYEDAPVINTTKNEIEERMEVF